MCCFGLNKTNSPCSSSLRVSQEVGKSWQLATGGTWRQCIDVCFLRQRGGEAKNARLCIAVFFATRLQLRRHRVRGRPERRCRAGCRSPAVCSSGGRRLAPPAVGAAAEQSWPPRIGWRVAISWRDRRGVGPRAPGRHSVRRFHGGATAACNFVFLGDNIWISKVSSGTVGVVGCIIRLICEWILYFCLCIIIGQLGVFGRFELCMVDWDSRSILEICFKE